MAFNSSRGEYQASQAPLTDDAGGQMFQRGWTGRTKKRSEDYFDKIAEKGAFFGELYDDAVEYAGDELKAGDEEYKKLKYGYNDFDKFNSGFVGKNFPEISEKYGTAQIQTMLAENQVEAVESALVHSGKTFDELRGLGLTRQQVLQEAQNRTQDPQELALVNSELDRVYGKLDESGWVKPDPNITDVSDKVTTARQGGDPTANKAPEEVVKKAQFDEGDIYAQAIDKTASTLHGNHITPQNWYESRSFNMGLMRFGLGLLSGEDYATAFSNAAQDYTKLSDREKREAYADELISSGYDKASVMQWIDEGKSNILSKPERWETITDKESGTKYQRSSLSGKLSKLEDAPDSYSTFRDKTTGTLFQQENRTKKLSVLESGYGYDEAGNPITTKSGRGSGKGPTEAESKARFGGNRAQAAVNIWNRDYYGKNDVYPLATRAGTYYTGMADESSLKNLYGVTLGEEERAAAGKERAFLAGVLRPESGAAVSNSEWTNYGTIFFDRFGDDQRTKNQKAWMRDMTVMALQRAGNDFTEENEEAEARKIIKQMASAAGEVVEYNPHRRAVKMSDGKWYSADFNLR